MPDVADVRTAAAGCMAASLAGCQESGTVLTSTAATRARRKALSRVVRDLAKAADEFGARVMHAHGSSRTGG